MKSFLDKTQMFVLMHEKYRDSKEINKGEWGDITAGAVLTCKVCVTS